MALALRDWGCREYGDALAEMRELRTVRRRGDIADTLVLVEHPPVVTVGVQGAGDDPLPTDVPVFHVERGGHATYHGLGQLVGYPIVDLDRRGRDVRRFVHETEGVVIDALDTMGVPAGRVEGRRGVWVDGQRKIASVGVAVLDWVTLHGFALNVNIDLHEFTRIRPCGFDAAVMTSIERETRTPTSIPDAKRAVIASAVRVWGGDPTSAGPTGSTLLPAMAPSSQ